MGCASSRQKRCRQCRSPLSPVPRSYSMHVHHPAQHKGDSYHVVALTSTTLGSLKLDFNGQTIPNQNGYSIAVNGNHETEEKTKEVTQEEKIKGFPVEVVEAKVWSQMISEKIPKIVPKTPTRTPPGEPETINTWELMAGLEDVSPFRSPGHFRSFSFDVDRSPAMDLYEPQKPKNHDNCKVSPKPMWLQMSDDDQNAKFSIPEFDPEVISSFRQSMEELSPAKPTDVYENKVNGVVSDLHESENDANFEKKLNGVVSDCKSGKEKVVLYFTTLRGVRKTYEDCCHVRVILKGLNVRVDERDVSMHSGFKDELKELMGEGFKGGLPRVFIGERYIGGADEIRRMNEEGQLEKLLEGCETMDDDSGGHGGACEACGDVRFLPCETCSGSCKVYYEGDEEEEEEGEEEYGFQRCPDCNENGLIRCPVCCF